MRRLLRRWRRHDPDPAPAAGPEKLSAERISAGYRVYWTKQALTWDAERRLTVAGQVRAATIQPGFENNALERRYHVAALDDQAHSGASLLALAEVLLALDIFETSSHNEQ